MMATIIKLLPCLKNRCLGSLIVNIHRIIFKCLKINFKDCFLLLFPVQSRQDAVDERAAFGRAVRLCNLVTR